MGSFLSWWVLLLWMDVTGALGGTSRMPTDDNEGVALVRPRDGTSMERELLESPGWWIGQADFNGSAAEFGLVH